MLQRDHSARVARVASARPPRVHRRDPGETPTTPRAPPRAEAASAPPALTRKHVSRVTARIGSALRIYACTDLDLGFNALFDTRSTKCAQRHPRRVSSNSITGRPLVWYPYVYSSRTHISMTPPIKKTPLQRIATHSIRGVRDARLFSHRTPSFQLRTRHRTVRITKQTTRVHYFCTTPSA